MLPTMVHARFSVFQSDTPHLKRVTLPIIWGQAGHLWVRLENSHQKSALCIVLDNIS